MLIPARIVVVVVAVAIAVSFLTLLYLTLLSASHIFIICSCLLLRLHHFASVSPNTHLVVIPGINQSPAYLVVHITGMYLVYVSILALILKGVLQY